jgi:hypothetical protein
MNVTVRERSGDDAVVVVRIALPFHERHASARRTTFEVGVLRAAVVEGLHDLLGLQRHLVRRTVAEVDHLLGVTDRPRAALFLVTGVRTGGGVAKPQCLRHLVVQPLNRSRKATVADSHELPVPLVGRREPDLHVDDGVGCRLEDELNAAMLRDHRGRCCGGCGIRSRLPATTSARGRRTFSHHLRAADRGLVQLQIRETLARRSRCRGADKHEGDAGDHGDPPGVEIRDAEFRLALSRERQPE